MTQVARAPIADATLVLKLESPNSNYRIEVSLGVSADDASCWRESIYFGVSPGKKKPDEWEDIEMFLSRDEARVLRDFLTTLLGSADYRDEC